MDRNIARMWNAAFLMGVLLNSAHAQMVTPGKAYFIFGDSLVDPGNNNYIFSLARANFPPNGIDFPDGATGRFCNGRTVADVINERLNAPLLPAFKDPNTTGSAVLNGVNYASAAGGILDDTGANYIGRISQNQQIQQFQTTQQQFIQLLGPAEAKRTFANSLYFFVMGSNDYINNYLQPNAARASQYTPKQYETLLVKEFSRQLSALYNLGARKMAIFNVGPLGCIPSQLAVQQSPDGSCITWINDYVKGFNAALRVELDRLTSTLPGSTFIYGNAFDLVYDRVVNPAKYGLTISNRGCCGLGTYNGQIPCTALAAPCSNRNQYLFWDPFHPTEYVNIQLGDAFFSGGPSDISPMNVQQLLALP